MGLAALDPSCALSPKNKRGRALPRGLSLLSALLPRRVDLKPAQQHQNDDEADRHA
jgi:hypothetical protein